VYHLTARLGLKMAYVQANTSPVWPPTGIGLAALLLLGYRYWPGITLGVLLGSLLTGAPFDLAVGMSIGNTLEALVAVYLLKRIVSFHHEIDRIQDVVGLVLISLVCTTIGASLGTTTLMITGDAEWQYFWAIWITWWIGDLLGALVVAPVLLTWSVLPKVGLHRRGYLEGGLLLLTVAAVTWFVFGSLSPGGILHQAMIYVIFPFIIWAAIRFGQHGATLAIAAVSGIAIFGTASGMGPFSLESKNDSLVLLQTFTAVVALTGLILAAATMERRRANNALSKRVDDLATLNDTSRTLLDNFEITNIFETICRLAVTRLGLDVAWIETIDPYDENKSQAFVHGVSPNLLESLKKNFLPAGPQANPASPVISALPAAAREEETQEKTYQSYGLFPLLFSSRPIGRLQLLSREKSFFTSDNQVLLQSYANLASVAIQNALLLEEVRRSNKQLHALSQRLMKAQEEERLHLSRELHDESGQLLTALTVQLGLLERDLEQPGNLRERIDKLKNTANVIQDNLHRLAVNLRPASLDHLGLVTTVMQFIHEFTRQYSIPVDFETVGMEGVRLPIEVETAIFRIIQESLTNVVSHAHASRVDVLLNRHNHGLVMIVEDDGVGFLPGSPGLESHLGLFGMRERVAMLGGSLVIESSPGKGTTVKAEVPCHD
jgi:signal transduction histidine kinase